MNILPLTLCGVLGLCSAAAAQDEIGIDPTRLSERERTLQTESPPEEDAGPVLLPLALSESREEPDAELSSPTLSELLQGIGTDFSPFSLGASAGYLRAKDTDHGTWFGGVQARLRLGMFAAEASVQFHQNRYEHGAVVVTQYPVQLTAFLYLIPAGPIRPYILGGVGWYYTEIDYEHELSFIPTSHQNIFGEHLGAGAELFLAPRLSVDADVRYIFLNPSTNQVIGREFNYWQITAGINFFF